MWENLIFAIPIGLFLGFVALPKKYEATEAKELPEQKPRLVFYPSYTSSFSSLTSIKEQLLKLGYKSSIEDIYEKGSVFGDFSTKIAKTRVEINPQKSTFKISYGGAGAFFDTGDLWKIATSLNKC